MDVTEESWRVVADVIDAKGAMSAYQSGGWGPVEVSDLTEDGWR